MDAVERKAARAYWRGVEEALGAPSMSKQEVVEALALYLDVYDKSEVTALSRDVLHDAMYFLQLDD